MAIIKKKFEFVAILPNIFVKKNTVFLKKNYCTVFFELTEKKYIYIYTVLISSSK
jgi:hypothetical protein